jgi:hypothetical protein
MDVIVGGFVSGILSDAVTYPLSTVKVRLQVMSVGKNVAKTPIQEAAARVASTTAAAAATATTTAGGAAATATPSVLATASARPIPTGTFSLLRHIAVNEGASRLYTGFSINLLTGPGRALYFGAYEACYKYLNQFLQTSASTSSAFGGSSSSSSSKDDEKRQALARGVAGPLAQLAGSLIWVPMDCCKERMQAQLSTTGSSAAGSQPQYRGPFNVASRVVAEEGFRALYRGFTLHQMLWGPFNALFFPMLGGMGESIEAMRQKQHCSNNSSSTGSNAASLSALSPSPSSSSAQPYQREWWITPLSAFTAASIAGFLTAPLDTIKTRLQTNTQYKSGRDCVRQMLRDESWQAMWRGATTRAIWIGPNMMITVSLYEIVRKSVKPYVSYGDGGDDSDEEERKSKPRIK